ncbi:MAG: tRNA pseudouridine(38-40) synthase TruA, partial [Clostridia bacterium]
GFVSGRLDIKSMATACSYLVGTHDFRCFMASGSRIGETVRTVYEAFAEMEGDIVSFDIKGNGFLYNMVRIIAGTLVDIGTGKTNPHDMIDIIAGKDRGRAGKTMPAEGLYLVDVFY